MGRELAGDVLRFSPKPEKKKNYFIRDGSRNFVIVHTSGQLFFILASAHHIPPAIYCVNTVTEGWVGAPNERTPFRIHDAVVGSVGRCLSRTRNLAASNYTSARVFLRPIWAQPRPQNSVFSGAFQKRGTFRTPKRSGHGSSTYNSSLRT